jgi:hypothetical protein
MGQALAEAFPEARNALDEVDEAVGQNLSRLMAEGPGAQGAAFLIDDGGHGHRHRVLVGRTSTGRRHRAQ